MNDNKPLIPILLTGVAALPPVEYPVVVNFDGDETEFFDGAWTESGGSITNPNIATGAEEVTNGDFSAWTGDDPDDWTVTESPAATEVSEVGTGEGNGGSGTGSCNFLRSGGGGVDDPRALQEVTPEKFYAFEVEVSFDGNGQMQLTNDSNSTNNVLNGVGTKNFTGMMHETGGDTQIKLKSATDPADITLDSVSALPMTQTSLMDALKSNIGLADGFFLDVYINVHDASYQTAVMWNIDNVSNPQNYAMAIFGFGGGKLTIWKSVAGVLEKVGGTISQGITPNQILRIENPTGTNELDILYNGVSKATPTIADASIISNTGVALLTTLVTNSFSKFEIGEL